jgi:hypothetical protein
MCFLVTVQCCGFSYLIYLQDVAERITNFSQHGPWAVCILSANGSISTASLWHCGISSGAVPYEVMFSYIYVFMLLVY